MGKDANSSRRCRRQRGPDASRGGQGPTVPMRGGHRAPIQAAGQAAAAIQRKGDGL